MTLQAFNVSDSQPVTAPYKIDPFKGSTNGEVSRQWASRPADQRFLDLSSLHGHLQRRADSTNERIVGVKQIEFLAPEPESLEDTHKLAVALPGGAVVGPTHWSFGQLAQLANFSSYELRKLPTQLGADVLNYMMHRAREVPEIKVFDAEGALRAAVGPKYGWIKDADVVDAVRQIAGNGTGDARWKIPGVIDWRNHTYDPFAPVTKDSTTLYASDRDVFMFLVDDTHPIEVGKLSSGEPDYMFRGFYVSNSEVGAGSMKLAAFYLRGVCMNRNLWGVEHFDELTIRHTSQARPASSKRPAQRFFPSRKAPSSGSAKASPRRKLRSSPRKRTRRSPSSATAGSRPSEPRRSCFGTTRAAPSTTRGISRAPLGRWPRRSRPRPATSRMPTPGSRWSGSQARSLTRSRPEPASGALWRPAFHPRTKEHHHES
jgi:hypothetical protein